MKIMPHPSPNHGERRGRTAPDLVVLHYTAMKTPAEALERLCSPDFEVSAHYLISEDGVIHRLVEEDRRAWHAGLGAWGATTDVNSASIGIELCNTGAAPFAARMMDALEALLADLLARHAIPPERVIAHSDCAPGRKIDPGARFDWRRLALGGLSVWPEAREAEPDAEAFDRALTAIGYTAEASPDRRLAAFRLRFRPGATGPLDARDMGIAEEIARRWPADCAVDRAPATS